MTKRGRPNKNGVKPGWMLLRSVMVLHAYDQAMNKGQKRSAAIAEAISTVRSLVPEMRISETGVKRVLAEFRSKDSERGWIIKEGIARGRRANSLFKTLEWVANESCGKWVVPSFSHIKSEPRRLRTFRIDVGPQPRYPRYNARS